MNGSKEQPHMAGFDGSRFRGCFQRKLVGGSTPCWELPPFGDMQLCFDFKCLLPGVALGNHLGDLGFL